MRPKASKRGWKMSEPETDGKLKVLRLSQSRNEQQATSDQGKVSELPMKMNELSTRLDLSLNVMQKDLVAANTTIAQGLMAVKNTLIEVHQANLALMKDYEQRQASLQSMAEKIVTQSVTSALEQMPKPPPPLTKKEQAKADQKLRTLVRDEIRAETPDPQVLLAMVSQVAQIEARSKKQMRRMIWICGMVAILTTILVLVGRILLMKFGLWT